MTKHQRHVERGLFAFELQLAALLIRLHRAAHIAESGRLADRLDAYVLKFALDAIFLRGFARALPFQIQRFVPALGRPSLQYVTLRVG